MDWLRREIAPLSKRVWDAIDEAVHTSARHSMAARRVADFDGPRGWDKVAVRLGTMRPLSGHEGKALLSLPDVILLTEIRSNFSIGWGSIEVYERGGPVLDTGAAEEAAREVALAEDRLVFHGGEASPGFLKGESSEHRKLGDWTQPGQAEDDLLGAVAQLDRHGIPGPYEVILDPEHYYIFQRATAQGGGYPAAKQLKDVIKGVHRSHVLKGGALFSTRGEDFVLTVGGDLSVGYRWHDENAVHLFCAESVAAQTLTPEAVCVLEQ